MHYLITIIFLVLSISCKDAVDAPRSIELDSNYKLKEVEPGAKSIDLYMPLLKGKRIAGVFNQSSLKGDGHLVDYLIQEGVDIQKIFALEHGFRGSEDAGAKVEDDKDAKTGIPLISLYGKKKKPSKTDLLGVDIVVFDIQDVGVRFYTFISTLHYIMEACAEYDIPLVILDRPNPNGHYIDGPVLEKAYKSFVGMHEVPTVYGMTIGEYGQMIKGEKWITNADKCNLTVIPCQNYNHETKYDLPVKPSPNLPNYRSVLLYPSICFFEGTSVSVGRGTDKQFQCIGHPALIEKEYTFTPIPKLGAMQPKLEGKLCHGDDLSTLSEVDIFNQKRLDISYLLDYCKRLQESNKDFMTRPDFFDKLAGTDKLRKQILSNESEDDIRDSWSDGLTEFAKVREKYLLYD